MQKSRRAKLIRQQNLMNYSLIRNRLFKASFMLVFVACGLLFLLNSIIGRGDGFPVVDENGEPVLAWKLPFKDQGNELVSVGKEEKSEKDGQSCMAPYEDGVENTLEFCNVMNPDTDSDNQNSLKGEEEIDQTKNQESLEISENNLGFEVSNPESGEPEIEGELIFQEETSPINESLMEESIEFEQSLHNFPSSEGSVQEHIVKCQESLCEGNGTKQETPTLPKDNETKLEDKDMYAETHGLIEDKAAQLENHRMPEEKETQPEIQRLTRFTPVGFDEFKKKASYEKDQATGNQHGFITQRLEPGGGEYNYAAASKGAKILAHNKEGKGVQNILDKDKDKYLRNPCSAEEKFVVIELSEETLVESIVIANFEHYSSNLKEFQLLSSLVYPTDDWVLIGNFTAENVKQAQKIPLQEPKWARYLKLRFLSHYGTEFFCTLSMVEVYGIDAIECMLENWIADGENGMRSGELSGEQATTTAPSVTMDGIDNDLVSLFEGLDMDKGSRKKETELSKSDGPKIKEESLKVNPPETKTEIIQQQGGRMGGDTVLKILMQKVRSLELNLSVLERYLEQLNLRYGDLFSDFDKELGEDTQLLRHIRAELNDLQSHKKKMEEEMQEYRSWRSTVSSDLNEIAAENKFLRLEIQNYHQRLEHLINKELVVLFVSFIFGSIAILKFAIDQIVMVFRICKIERASRPSLAWVLLLLSSCLAAFILSI